MIKNDWQEKTIEGARNLTPQEAKDSLIRAGVIDENGNKIHHPMEINGDPDTVEGVTKSFEQIIRRFPLN